MSINLIVSYNFKVKKNVIFIFVLMKNRTFIVSILFCTLVLYNTLRVPLTYIYYNIDTAGFIELLCVNKDKPELACNGQCHLEKVNQSSDDNENKSIKIIELKQLLYLNQNATRVCFDQFLVKLDQTIFYLNLYDYRFLISFFHPPNA